MAFWDKLAHLLKKLVSVDIKIDLRRTIYNINVVSNDKNPPVEIDEKKKTIQINQQVLTSQDKLLFKEVIKEAVSEDYVLIEKNSEAILEDFSSSESKTENQTIIDEVKDFIPPSDLLAFRASLFLRDKYKAGENVNILKKGIVERFGDRGRKICNLTSAGYFDQLIVPLIRDAKAKKDFSKDDFLKIYDLIIDQSAFAIFVAGPMSDNLVTDGIRQKIEVNQTYGLNHTFIHGIGKSNIEKIRKSVEEVTKTVPGVEKTFEQIIGKAIFVKLELAGEKESSSKK